MIGRYCIIRSKNAGVFAGIVESVTETPQGKDVLIRNARRIWYWAGASSLSELAVKGTSEPSKCKFPCVVSENLVSEVIEIIPTTDVAKSSILGVPEWTQH